MGKIVVDGKVKGNGAYMGGDLGAGASIGGYAMYQFGKTQSVEGKVGEASATEKEHGIGVNLFANLDRAYGNWTSVGNQPVSSISPHGYRPWFFLGNADVFYQLDYIYASGKVDSDGNLYPRLGKGTLKVGAGLIDQMYDYWPKDRGINLNKYATPNIFSPQTALLGGYIDWSNTFVPYYKLGVRTSVGTGYGMLYMFDDKDKKVFDNTGGTILSLGVRNTIYPFADFPVEKDSPTPKMIIYADLGGMADVKTDKGYALQGNLAVDWLTYENEKKNFDLHLIPGVTGGATYGNDMWKPGILASLQLAMNIKLGDKVGKLTLMPYGTYGWSRGGCFADDSGLVTCMDGTAGYSGLHQYYGSTTGAGSIDYDTTIHSIGYGLDLKLGNAFGVKGLALTGTIGGGTQGVFNNGEGSWTTMPLFKLGVEYAFSV